MRLWPRVRRRVDPSNRPLKETSTEQPRFVCFFDRIGLGDVPLVGGKNASLGEMYSKLAGEGVRVPNGFAVSTEACRDTLETAGVLGALRAALDGLDTRDMDDPARCRKHARGIVYGAGLPADLATEIIAGYRKLQSEYGDDVSLAVCSSATAEDMPPASFAGQQETFLNIQGDESLLDACRRDFASLFTDSAIHYRVDQVFDHFQVALSIGVMKMVRSDLVPSGVMFSIDTVSGFRDAMFITGAYGLGKNVVQGAVDPDEFYVHMPTHSAGHRALLRRTFGDKPVKMVYVEGEAGRTTRNIRIPRSGCELFCLGDADVLELAGAAIHIERHDGQAMDIEWSKDGSGGKLYVVQARRETVASQRQPTTLELYAIAAHGDPIVVRRAVGEKIASGKARVISDLGWLRDFKLGEARISDTTTQDWEPVMKSASAIVTNRGRRARHAAIVARELDIPGLVGTVDATRTVADGAAVTVSCAEGDTDRIYSGEVPFHVEGTEVAYMPRPQTRIMVNSGNLGLAFKTSLLPNDGVGLARMEFIVTEYIKAHLPALPHLERVRDPGERDPIARVTRGHPGGEAFFVQRLSEGIGPIAAALWPKPVVLRNSDFKTNEYASLIASAAFEPIKANQMLGFRGSARYAYLEYAAGLRLQCLARRRVREDMVLDNVVPMLPLVRRVRVADDVLANMAQFGLERGRNGLEVYAMCEIPNSVLLIDVFATRFDGLSIDSNDPIQLTLGVDRDSEIAALDYEERDDGVKEMTRLAVQGCKRNRIHSGLCDQAPSDYPEMAEFLVEIGSESMSLNGDSLIGTALHVLEVDARLGRPPRAADGMGRLLTVSHQSPLPAASIR